MKKVVTVFHYSLKLTKNSSVLPLYTTPLLQVQTDVFFFFFCSKDEAFKHLQHFAHTTLRPQVQQVTDVDEEIDSKRQHIVALLAKYVL